MPEAEPLGAPPTDPLRQFRTAWWQRLLLDDSSYEITRFLVLRLFALVELVAFIVLVRQMDPLIGSHGLLPAAQWLDRVRAHMGAGAYWKVPTLLWFDASDRAMHLLAWTGVVLSAAALLGATNAVVQIALWAIYMSFVHAGQIFYGYGWEIQLLETALLAALLCPVRSVRPFPETRTPVVAVWLLRWLVFRVMVGAALIKLRGDPCWRDFTCLDFHFETQPNPSPLSWWFHHAPHAAHVVGVAFNHLVELFVPWFVFGPRRVRHVAGALLVLFQCVLIASGNLAFLNWLTIVPALACFDDTAWTRLLPRARRARLLARFADRQPGKLHARVAKGYAVLVALLSVAPVVNLFSNEQTMNTSFEPFDLVNTYGAFGSIDRARFEVVLEGTRDDPDDPRARWQEYELPCQPGDVRRRPCLITPYHYRLDWQMWFVGNAAPRGEPIEDEPWLVHLVWQLLQGDPTPRSLFARDPFTDAPPRAIRAGIWRYRFADDCPVCVRTPSGRADDRSGGRWWQRQRVGEFLGPVTKQDLALRGYVAAFGWGGAPP